MRKNFDQIFDEVQKEPWASNYQDRERFWGQIKEWTYQDLFPKLLKDLSDQIDTIVDIDIDLSEPKIFGLVTQYMVYFLGAASASVRIYDPYTHQMLSYGSYPSKEESRQTYLSLENSIAGDVVMNHATCLVPNILEEDRYHDKSVVTERGVNSLMAVPLGIPRFFPQERDMTGVIQIYFKEKDREFAPIETIMAELMSKRLSFVIARKKIMSMHRLNEKKEAIVRNIFLKLGSRGGVKLKESFNRVIPELADIINLQSCALFSVSEDLKYVKLDAGFSRDIEYHGIGKRFPISDEPIYEVVLNLRKYTGDSTYEVITPSYSLIADPLKSTLVSEQVKKLAVLHNINSILYMPLNVGEEITHFITFDALDDRKRYTEEEIDLFLFLGRELMKAQRMEWLDDILHDFKNPAIATAGFARRLKKMLEEKEIATEGSKIKRYLDILQEETSRIQEMALSIYQVGEEQIVDLSDILRNRFEINQEAIKELLKQNIDTHEGPFQKPLFVRCYPIHLERILDNLLNNATKAIPIQGGTLVIRTYAEDKWACAEITNTGLITEEERLRLLEGEGQGRGIYITHRIIRLIKGKLEIIRGINTTTFVVRLPLHE